MPNDDVTIGELRRAMDSLRRSVDELSSHVKNLAVLEYRIGEAEGDIDEIKREQIRNAERRGTDRRLVFSALVAPVILLIVEVYAKVRGASA